MVTLYHTFPFNPGIMTLIKTRRKCVPYVLPDTTANFETPPGRKCELKVIHKSSMNNDETQTPLCRLQLARKKIIHRYIEIVAPIYILRTKIPDWGQYVFSTACCRRLIGMYEYYMYLNAGLI